MTETAFDVALRTAREATGTAEDLQRLKRHVQQALANLPAGARAANTSRAAISVSHVLGGAACVFGLGALGYLALGQQAAVSPAASKMTLVVSPPMQPTPLEPAQVSAAPTARSNAVLVPDAHVERKAANHPHARSQVPHAPRASEPLPQATTAVSDPTAEVSLISRAQSLLDRHPQAALDALIEHAQRFPHGVLAEERDGLRFDAERALGHTADAITHARAFCAQYPGSPQTRRLERWLATHESAAPVQP